MTCFLPISEAFEGLQTPRLSFRATRVSDAVHLFDATRNRFFNRHLLWAQPSCLEEVVTRMVGLEAQHREGVICAMSVWERKTGRWVGLVRLVPTLSNREMVEIGLWIHGDFYRAFYGFEISSAAIDIAFRQAPVAEVVAASTPLNRGAHALIERCGFTHHGSDFRFHEDGQRIDLLEFRLPRSRWVAMGHGFDPSALAGAASG